MSSPLTSPLSCWLEATQAGGDRWQFLGRIQGANWAGRFHLADHSQEIPQSRSLHERPLQRRRPRQEFIQHHAQRIDVAASVDVKFAELCLLGDMYSRVPMTAPSSVLTLFSVSRGPVALAMPKSITFGTGLPS